MLTNEDTYLKLVLFKTALQAIIIREGLLESKSKEQIAKEAMKYAESAMSVWEQESYQKSVL